MEEQKPQNTKSSNPNYTNTNPQTTAVRNNKNKNNTKKNSKNKISEFEFCKVCNYSHDRGQKHKYFSNHTKSLTSFLFRFQNKLSEVRFFLKNPTSLRPEHASRNRLWCVFCDSDIDEIGSSFACSNAIKHLASADHLKNLKTFLWKYGGGMDRVDSFTVSNVDLAKWDKKCMSLKIEVSSASEGSRECLIGPSYDIHNGVDIFDKNVLHSFDTNVSNSVLPLQNDTNENYQVSDLQFPQVADAGHRPRDVTTSLQLDTRVRNGVWSTNHLIGRTSRDGHLDGGEVCSAKRKMKDESSSQVEETTGNVHSGAPPPWFERTELIPESGANVAVSPLSKPGKVHKLNPKRIGAAWAEKRKHELEMEKRGELVTNHYNDNWLPNFGSVWQSGSRKESRKEFEMEKKKLPKIEIQSEVPVKIQPYISKRMRRDEDGDVAGVRP